MCDRIALIFGPFSATTAAAASSVGEVDGDEFDVVWPGATATPSGSCGSTTPSSNNSATSKPARHALSSLRIPRAWRPDSGFKATRASSSASNTTPRLGAWARTRNLRFAVMDLRYLYVGSSDVGRDVAAWLAVPGARMRWRFQHFGADVAAVDLGSAPTVLLADHRPPGSVLPIYAVVELDGVRDALEQHGWTIEASRSVRPRGRRRSCTTSAGTTIALLRVDRPAAMERRTHPGQRAHGST